MLRSNYWFLVLSKGSLITYIKSNLKIISVSKYEVEHLISFPQIFKFPFHLPSYRIYRHLLILLKESNMCKVLGFFFSFFKELIISVTLVNNWDKEKASFQPPLPLLSHYFLISVRLMSRKDLLNPKAVSSWRGHSLSCPTPADG